MDAASRKPAEPIRLSSVMGVARAMLGTFTPAEAVEVMIIEFGWDVTFQALLLLRGEDAEQALLRTLERLVTEDVSQNLDGLRRTSTD